jgi:DNA invertase Pin-like site-specific DNA recombinase
MKAIGYVRVSTEGQAKEGVSLDNQKDRIKSYCQYKGLELLQIIEDAGISGGKNKSRPGFMELLETIESQEIDIVVLYSLERLSRDMLTLLALERYLNEKNVELHTIEGHVDTSTPDGWLSFAMKAFLGEMERRQVKYRTKKAMEYKKQQGNIVGAIPYGHRRNGNGLELDESEQAVIQFINSLYLKSYKLKNICAVLHEKGIRTRKSKQFTPEQVRRIITGYEGKFVKTKSGLLRNIRQFVEAID